MENKKNQKPDNWEADILKDIQPSLDRLREINKHWINQ
jgi:hypothetical protein